MRLDKYLSDCGIDTRSKCKKYMGYIKTSSEWSTEIICCAKWFIAKKLYAQYGFTENGEMDDEEVVAVLKL